MLHFAHPFPWWVAVLAAAAVVALALVEYRRPIAPLTWARRATLIALRTIALAALILVLFRPIVLLPPANAHDTLVPVLVDVSRSMRIVDADGQARIARAASLLKSELMPALSRQFRVKLFGVGQTLAPTTIEALGATARETDLNGALTAIRERTRGQRVAGIILISDGADTGHETGAALARAAGGPTVFAIGVGSARGPRDREVVGVTAGEQRLDQASVDLHVSATSSGYGRAPFQLRLLANGRLLENRRVVPPSDGSPIDERFTVSPDPLVATVYTAEIPADGSEAVVENNARSVLVSPAGRKRRLLVVAGAPGFEHSFMQRAWVRDPGLEVDSVVRKGKNADGNDTFFVQAATGRASALANGFPARREDLYAYDALVIANVEGDFFTRAQLALIADLVAERGGGLLVTGGRSFAQRGLVGTPVEVVLPVELDDRRGGLVRTALVSRDAHNKLAVTPEGETHPIMRIGESAEVTRKLWTSLPTLAASAPIGGPRPGATVLAVTSAAGGEVHPVVAVQRYGRGRSMIFAGEASWRWKMLLPSADRTYELFWRQAARWLASSSPDPVAITAPDAPEPGESISIEVDARDGSFAPVADAAVDASIVSPEGRERPLTLRRAEAAGGRFSAAIRLDAPGLYRVRATARRGAASLGAGDKWMYVGGADREFVDPRLNEPFLRRIARASGGRYVRAADASHVMSWLQSTARESASPERGDLWHEPWVFAAVVLLLSAEWVLRRRWGLR